MFRNWFFGLLLVAGFGLTLSSCAPGVYGGTSVGVGVGGYGPGYYGGYGPSYYNGYGPRYYGYGGPIIVNPRPVIINPRPRFYGGYHGDAGYHGGGYRSGFNGGGGRRGGR